MSNEGTRLAVRLTPDYELHLRLLLRETAARTKAEIVRWALRALKSCWAMMLQSDRLEVHRMADGRLESLFALTPYAGDDGPEPSCPRYRYILQLRLGPEDAALLTWLRTHDVASTDSGIIRLAISVLAELRGDAGRGLGLFARFGTELVHVDLPPLDAAASALTESIGVLCHAEPRDLLALRPNDHVSLEEIRRLHMVYPWQSVLVKIDTLYDDTAFLDVIENHLWRGTKLYYVLNDTKVLSPLAIKLSQRTGNLHLKWREFVHVIPRGHDEDYANEEFVVFNFFNEGHMTGYMWHADGHYGVVASEDELITLTREFRQDAEAEDRLETLIVKDLPVDHRVAVRVPRDSNGRQK